MSEEIEMVTVSKERLRTLELLLEYFVKIHEIQKRRESTDAVFAALSARIMTALRKLEGEDE